MKGEKKSFGCSGSGWSGKEWVYTLTKKAENFTEYSLSTVKTFSIILGPLNNIETHSTASQNHIPVCLEPYGLLRLHNGFQCCS